MFEEPDRTLRILRDDVLAKLLCRPARTEVNENGVGVGRGVRSRKLGAESPIAKLTGVRPGSMIVAVLLENEHVGEICCLPHPAPAAATWEVSHAGGA